MIKRIYDEPAKQDGYRVLVDRLWPRGVSKDKAQLDEWLKDVAPSPELRTWFDHKPERFQEFSARYQVELAHNPAAQEIKKLCAQQDKITLLYGARDPEINHAVILEAYINKVILPTLL